MSKELSDLIKEVDSTEKMDNINIRNFLIKFKGGIQEEPEKIGELARAYEKLMKRSFPHTSIHERWTIIFKNLVRYCFLADNNCYEIDFEKVSLMGEPFFNYLLNKKKHGPATKALSNYLGCEGPALIMKIFQRHKLN